MWKRAQAAMEFLMTYGWAILVVLVVIGALAYFGVLNPSNLLPERCELPMGLSCRDYRVLAASAGTTGSNITLSVENGMGAGVQFTNFTATGKVSSSSISCNNTAPIPYLANGQVVTVTLDCAVGRIPRAVAGSAQKYKFDLIMWYYKEGSTVAYAHSLRGSLQTKVES